MSIAEPTRTLLVPIVLSGAALLAGPVAAADFRGLDFGVPCDRVPILEATRGSAAFDGELPSGYQFAFLTRELDREVLVVYACEGGKLFRAAYIFEARDEADATNLYATLKKRVTRERGSPTYDFASAEHRKKMSNAGATLSRSDTLVTFWEGPTSEAHASVSEPSKGHGWRVSLSYTANTHVEE
jgi:hypothetical protein